MATSNSKGGGIAALINGTGGGANPLTGKAPAAIAYILASPGAKDQGVTTQGDAKKFLAAYNAHRAAGNYGAAAGMHKRLKGTASAAAQKAAKHPNRGKGKGKGKG
jgi:hypothetical protein